MTKQEAAPSPPQVDSAEKKPEPPKSECKVDFGRWPTDRTEQAQAVQVLLRHLGYYRGTTNGTVGPQTRTAIREFQLASGEAETGEVSEALSSSSRRSARRRQLNRRAQATLSGRERRRMPGRHAGGRAGGSAR